MGCNVKIYCIFPLLLLFLAFSCDYQSNKEFINELTPPSPHVEIEIQLLPTEDTLKLFQPVTLNYNFELDSREFLFGSFKMGINEWQIHNPQGQLTLKPEDFEPGYHLLSMRIFFRTGTESVADQAGAEAYMAETDWVVVSDHRSAPSLTLNHYKNDQGLLALTWETCQQYNFEQYELRRWIGAHSTTFIFTNPEQTQFIDSCFFGKASRYRIYTRVKGHALWGTGDNSRIELETELPRLAFEPLGYDSVRIWWNNTDYSARFRLRRTNLNPPVTLLESSSDTSIVVAAPGFGSVGSYELTTLPFYETECGHTAFFSDYRNYYLGQNIAGNAPNYGYNYNERILYTNTTNTIFAYDIENFEIVNSVSIPQLMYGGNYSSPLNSSKIAATGRYHIYVFENQNLLNPSIIELPGMVSRDFLFLTENNKIATTLGNEFRLYNVDSQQLITSFEIVEMPYYSSWAGLGVSLDASFTGIATHNGMWLYQRVDDEYQLFHNNNQSYRSILFHPTDPTKVFYTFREEPDLFLTTLPGLIQDQTWELPNSCLICNIDPHTGYMLLRDILNQKLYIMDLNTGLIVFSIRSSDFKPRLYNSRLLSRSGFAYDISPFLPN